jgi:hypothetical protein
MKAGYPKLRNAVVHLPLASPLILCACLPILLVLRIQFLLYVQIFGLQWIWLYHSPVGHSACPLLSLSAPSWPADDDCATPSLADSTSTMDNPEASPASGSSVLIHFSPHCHTATVPTSAVLLLVFLRLSYLGPDSPIPVF